MTANDLEEKEFQCQSDVTRYRRQEEYIDLELSEAIKQSSEVLTNIGDFVSILEEATKQLFSFLPVEVNLKFSVTYVTQHCTILYCSLIIRLGNIEKVWTNSQKTCNCN